MKFTKKLSTILVASITILLFSNLSFATNLALDIKYHEIQKKIDEIEESENIKVGISTKSVNDYSYDLARNYNDTFPLASTAKFMIVGTALYKAKNNPEILQKIHKYTKKQVEDSGYVPVTKNNLENGMSLVDLCEAAISYSDNLASNIILESIGGVEAVNDFAKNVLHIFKFRLDRYEPMINHYDGPHVKDVIAPYYMMLAMKKLLFENKFRDDHRELLKKWMINSKTGANRIISAFPNNWTKGNKTGTAKNICNDIAVIWPLKGSPILISIYIKAFEDKSTEELEQSMMKVSKMLFEYWKVVQVEIPKN